jgi:hypothetical protein
MLDATRRSEERMIIHLLRTSDAQKDRSDPPYLPDRQESLNLSPAYASTKTCVVFADL